MTGAWPANARASHDRFHVARLYKPQAVSSESVYVGGIRARPWLLLVGDGAQRRWILLRVHEIVEAGSSVTLSVKSCCAASISPAQHGDVRQRGYAQP